MTEIKGKIVQVLPTQTGVSSKGQWKKTEFIVEQGGQYRRKVCLAVFNKDLQFKVGDYIAASVDAESREYNGKWYTDIKAWQINHITETTEQHDPLAPPSSGSTDDLPF